MFKNINISFKIKRRTLQIGMLLLVTAIFFGSCRKEVETERLSSYYGRSYVEVFDAFWNGMNSNYVFWDIETVNWDNMYKTYKPRFEDLDKRRNDPKSAQQAAQFLIDMTKDLADSHLQLTFNGQVNYLISNYTVTSPVFQPSGIRHQLRGDRAPISNSVFNQVIPNNYLTNFEYGNDDQTWRINLGLIPRNNKKIVYMHYSSFQLGSQYYSANSTSHPVKPVLDNFFRYTKDPSIDGLILDLRNNPGGQVSDLNFLLGRLTTTDKHVAYTRTKNGSGRLDFTPWIKSYVHAQPGGTDFNKPIVVLTDMYSVSMSEMTTMSIKAIFPNAIIVGEKTWGGTGAIPYNDSRYLGGQFVAANFVQVYTAGVELRNKNLESYENKGIPPDVAVPFDAEKIKSNIDVQLDKAIEKIISQ